MTAVLSMLVNNCTTALLSYWMIVQTWHFVGGRANLFSICWLLLTGLVSLLCVHATLATCLCETSTPCALWGVMCPWFICWFRRYMYRLLVYLVSPTFLFTYFHLLTYFHTYLFPLRIGPVHSRPEVVRVNQTWPQVVSVYFEFFVFLMHGYFALW